MQINHWIEINAPEDDARIRGRRTQNHIDLDAGMETDTRGADQRFKSALPEHVLERKRESRRILTHPDDSL